MFKYRCLNPIAGIGLQNFTDKYVEAAEAETADVILVRSAKMHEMEFDPELLAIARAGAGVNNIPLDRCAEQGIVVFNTPGANANGVKELFIFAAIAGVRDVIGGIKWTASEAGNPDIAAVAEKEKKRFVGHEIMGKTLGVIGLGAIGVKVANAAVDLGMKVVGYDPYLSDAAKATMSPSIETTDDLDVIAAKADLITIHVPAMPATNGMINKEYLAKCKDRVVVINLARDTLVNEPDMAEALENGKVSRYVCDFPTPGNAGMKNAIIIPHLGASTEESEDNCAVMAVQELMDYLENGNIRNSVNYPAVSFGTDFENRVCVAHKAEVKAADLAEAVKAAGAEVNGTASKERGNFAYTIMDVSATIDAAALLNMDGVLKARIITK